MLLLLLALNAVAYGSLILLKKCVLFRIYSQKKYIAQSISLNSYFVGHKMLQLSQKSHIVCFVEIVMLIGL